MAVQESLCRHAKTAARHVHRCTFCAFVLAVSARVVIVASAGSDISSSSNLQNHIADHVSASSSLQNRIARHGIGAEQRVEEVLPVYAKGHIEVTYAEGAAAIASGYAQAILEGSATLKEAAARLKEQHAALALAANQAVAQLTGQKDALVQAAGQAAAKWAERTQQDLKEKAAQAAAQLADRLAEGPEILKAAAERVGKQHVTLQETASKALAQLSDWTVSDVANQARGLVGEPLAQFSDWTVSDVANQAKKQFSEQHATLRDAVANVGAQLSEHQTMLAQQFSEQHATLRNAVATVGAQLSERQTMLTQAATQAATHVTQFCLSCGQDALRQAATTATAQLAEHEMLLRESAALIAVQVANLQAAISPSAGRIAAQLAELLCESEDYASLIGTCSLPPADGDLLQQRQQSSEAPTSSPQKPLARAYLLSARRMVQGTRYDFYLSCACLGMVAICLCSTIFTIGLHGGEDASSLSYPNFVRRAAVWFVHRIFLGWALLSLSDVMAEAPLHIPKYDAMGWPMWSTLLPLSTQLFFFVPAAAILNTNVAMGSSPNHTQESHRFCASLSREVHASLVGCFTSDWLLFPTDLVFFGHHILGLGIIFGVWNMVLDEARLLSTSAPDCKARFFWVTGLSVASMEASSFFFNLYSVISPGALLNLSLFAVFTYSNVLCLMCVLSQHPWGTSIKVIWVARSFLSSVIERTQAAFPQVRIPSWLSSKTTSDSVSYLWKSFMVSVLCLARHFQMWCYVREQLSSSSVVIVGAACVGLAGALVWRLQDFEGRGPHSDLGR
jgi:hypothetical protein